MVIAHRSIIIWGMTFTLTLPIQKTEVMLILTKTNHGQSTLIKVNVILYYVRINQNRFPNSFHPHRDEFVPNSNSRVWTLFGTGTFKSENVCHVSSLHLQFWFQIRQGRHWRHSGLEFLYWCPKLNLFCSKLIFTLGFNWNGFLFTYNLRNCMGRKRGRIRRGHLQWNLKVGPLMFPAKMHWFCLL